MKDQGPAPALDRAAAALPLLSGAEAPVLEPEAPETKAGIDMDLLLAQENWLRAVARHLVRDPARAEDVAQETLLAAIQSPPRDAEDPRRLRAWLGRVAHNLAHLDTRRRMRRRAREERVARGESQSSVADVVLHGSILAEVELAVSQLEEPYQSAVRARYFEGQSTQDIARATATTDNAVRKRLWRAREKLRQILDRRHNGDRLAWFNALGPVVLLPEPTATAIAATEAAAGQAAGSQAGLLTSGWKLAAAVTAVATGAIAFGIRSPEVLAADEGPTQVGMLDWSERVSVVAPPAKEVDSARTEADASREAVLGIPSERAAVTRPDGEGPSEKRGETADEELEDGALPSLTGRVLHASDGLPLAGVRIGTLATLATEDFESGVLAVTDDQGRFTVEGIEGLVTSDLVVLDDHLATLRRGSVSVAADEGSETKRDEGLLLVTEAVDVAGRVVDEDGVPVAGARVRLQLDEAAWLHVDRVLEGTEALALSTVTDADGRFELERVPTGDGADLVVDPVDDTRSGAPLLEVATIDVPRGSRYDLLVALETAALQPVIVAGTVLLADDGPAEGAVVELGRYRTRTDARGEFELAVQDVAPDDDLRAFKRGWEAAELDDFGREVVATTALDRRDGVRLTLAQRARTLGATLDGLGGGSWALGSAGEHEWNLLDERGSASRLYNGVDPPEDGGLHGNSDGGGYDSNGGGSQGSHGGSGNHDGPPTPPPGSAGDDAPPLPPPVSRPDDGGRFDLPDFGPQDGDRWIRGFDPTSGRVLTAGPLVADDDDQRLDVDPLPPRPRFQGRLGDELGDPYDDAIVRVVVALGIDPGALGAPQNGPGVWDPVLWWESDDTVLTDDDGRFVLEDVPSAFASLRIDHPDLGSVLVPLPDAGSETDGAPADASGAPDGVTDDGEIVLPRLRAFRVDARTTPNAVAFRLLDEAGTVLPLHAADRVRETGRLFDGQSSVLRAAESARLLVLFDAERRELVRIPVLLDGSEEIARLH